MQPAGPLILASKTDPASLNIAHSLIHHHGFNQQEARQDYELYEAGDITLAVVNKDCIYLQPQDIPWKATTIIFASKHRSNTQTAALTVHATGNLTREALYGGNPEEVSIVEPFRIQAALIALKRGVEKAKLTIEVTMEATHHGPTNFPVPVCFIEIGSQPDQWDDKSLGEVAADAAMSAATSKPASGSAAVGIGGTHYPTKHTQVCQDGQYQIGHVVSKYAFDANVSDRVLSDTFKKTMGDCKTAVVDWKGLKGDLRRSLLDKLSRWNIEAVRV